MPNKLKTTQERSTSNGFDSVLLLDILLLARLHIVYGRQISNIRWHLSSSVTLAYAT